MALSHQLIRLPLAACAAIALAHCTAGGVAPSTSAGVPVTQITKINVSLAAYGQQSTPAGPALGFSPPVTTVPVGTGVQFVNVDNTAHTATFVGAGPSFPTDSPLTFAATTSQGNALSANWSSGTMQAGQSSQVFLVDRPGVYLYGCFFHYSGNMRGEIVAQ